MEQRLDYGQENRQIILETSRKQRALLVDGECVRCLVQAGSVEFPPHTGMSLAGSAGSIWFGSGKIEGSDKSARVTMRVILLAQAPRLSTSQAFTSHTTDTSIGQTYNLAKVRLVEKPMLAE